MNIKSDIDSTARLVDPRLSTEAVPFEEGKVPDFPFTGQVQVLLGDSEVCRIDIEISGVERPRIGRGRTYSDHPPSRDEVEQQIRAALGKK